MRPLGVPYRVEFALVHVAARVPVADSTALKAFPILGVGTQIRQERAQRLSALLHCLSQTLDFG